MSVDSQRSAKARFVGFRSDYASMSDSVRSDGGVTQFLGQTKWNGLRAFLFCGLSGPGC